MFYFFNLEKSWQSKLNSKICFSDSLIKKYPNFLCKDYFHLKFPISDITERDEKKNTQFNKILIN